jgi:hypothetical protein
MKNTTVRVIIILVALLFLNIEAAHAGLVQKIKIYIRHEFPNDQLLFIVSSILFLGCLGYILFAPVLIGKEKWAWLNYYSYQPNRHDYQNKRMSIKKISSILNNSGFSKQAHS